MAISFCTHGHVATPGGTTITSRHQQNAHILYILHVFTFSLSDVSLCTESIRSLRDPRRSEKFLSYIRHALTTRISWCVPKNLRCFPRWIVEFCSQVQLLSTAWWEDLLTTQLNAHWTEVVIGWLLNFKKCTTYSRFRVRLKSSFFTPPITSATCSQASRISNKPQCLTTFETDITVT